MFIGCGPQEVKLGCRWGLVKDQDLKGVGTRLRAAARVKRRNLWSLIPSVPPGRTLQIAWFEAFFGRSYGDLVPAAWASADSNWPFCGVLPRSGPKRESMPGNRGYCGLLKDVDCAVMRRAYVNCLKSVFAVAKLPKSLPWPLTFGLLDQKSDIAVCMLLLKTPDESSPPYFLIAGARMAPRVLERVKNRGGGTFFDLFMLGSQK